MILDKELPFRIEGLEENLCPDDVQLEALLAGGYRGDRLLLTTFAKITNLGHGFCSIDRARRPNKAFPGNASLIVVCRSPLYAPRGVGKFLGFFLATG